MKKGYFLLVLLVVFGALAGFSGCKKNAANMGRVVEFEKLAFAREVLDRAPGAPFAVSDTGEFFLLEDSKINRYAADGALLGSFEADGEVNALCLLGDALFFYDEEQDSLFKAIPESGKVVKVAKGLWFANVKNLVAAGDFLYADVMTRENGQMERALVKIHPNKGTTELIEMPEEAGEFCAVYGATDGRMYYCTQKGGTVFLYSYVENTGESLLVREITDRPGETASILAFSYEKDLFAYTTDSNYMAVLRLGEDAAAVRAIHGTTEGRDMVCAAGNLVYQGFSQETLAWKRESVYLGELAFEPLSALQGEFVTVCNAVGGLSENILDGARVKSATGIGTKYKLLPWEEYDSFLADVMAGNPDIDIYVFSISWSAAQAMREKGIFVPLNSSEILKGYQAACFPYLAEEMEAENGELWMLPIGIDADVIWYVEENMERLGISTEQFATMEDFLELSLRMKQVMAKTEYRAYAWPARICEEWLDDYSELYCDFAHGIVNYKTEVFYDLFAKLFDGWEVYGKDLATPYFRHAFEDFLGGNRDESPEYDRSRLVYQHTNVSDHLLRNGNLTDVTGWRVAALPKFSDELKGNACTITGMVINPYSRKKELALRYLEAVAKNPFGIYRGSNGSRHSFLFTDKEFYGDYYDFSQPAIQDLHQIFADGKLRAGVGVNRKRLINEYQCGRLTLTEVVDELQRETEMYLKE